MKRDEQRIEKGVERGLKGALKGGSNELHACVINGDDGFGRFYRGRARFGFWLAISMLE